MKPSTAGEGCEPLNSLQASALTAQKHCQRRTLHGQPAAGAQNRLPKPPASPRPVLPAAPPDKSSTGLCTRRAAARRRRRLRMRRALPAASRAARRWRARGVLEVLPSAYCHSPCTVFPPFACIYALSCFTTRHVTVAPCELHLSQGLSWRVGEVCKALGRAAAAQSMSPFQTRFWTALASIWALQVARNANERRSGRQLAGPSNSAAFWTSRLLSK